ncbi:hypothetical protein C0Q70_04399 [Pomacea canaliculata]|uniref:Uncharacterized protein n=1 Tax=Pomacea canaliculata TaxID=400727 RepID=A0A2T7PVH7_POMCA|nr:hypothetical protein C0Q70_04399 [Pomacea canaliculata]
MPRVSNGNQRLLSTVQPFDRQEIYSGLVPGIVRVQDSDTKPGADVCGAAMRNTTITLSQDIKASTFLRVLEFVYTGKNLGHKGKSSMSCRMYVEHVHTLRLQVLFPTTTDKDVLVDLPTCYAQPPNRLFLP